MKTLLFSTLCLLIAVVTLIILATTVVSAQQQQQQVGEELDQNTSLVATADSICDIGYLQNLRYRNATASITFIMSISPCRKTKLYSRTDSEGKPTGTSCGVGYVSWTEDTTALQNICLQWYDKNTTTGNTHMTKYFEHGNNNAMNSISVNWVCTGLQGDIDRTKAVITAVTGNHTDRVVTIQTKGCVRPPDNELRAGVIVAIVVVAVFVLAVIISVVKAKCFGSSNSSSSNTGHFGGAGAKPSRANNAGGTGAASTTSGNVEIGNNYQAMP